ncbi:ABC transporter permease [Flavisolibacter tropicus]|uniref:Transport permease protein n=1 Tax=Flavisolibacter tropicus TaxID=1492898 RepID=A0A172TRB9_9BACT|nr:ABC transporter permease [Flavisolibacter tropicus]ANE49629.1 ABC transporter [Flavisolibacter tropicus]
MANAKAQLSWVIKPQTPWLGASLAELISYKDLLLRLVRKEFLTSYQQTLLGPLWVLVQPLLTVATSILIFNKVIGISTDGVPPVLYYLTGITLWGLFSDIFTNTSLTFIQNEKVFSKVYFPRIISPLSIVLLNLFRFSIQLVFLIITIIYYYLTGQVELHISTWIIAFPMILLTIMMGFGAGMFFSVITAKYRDLTHLLQLLIRLLMFVCPVFYPLSIVPEKHKWLMNLNPLTTQFELYRYAFLGTGTFTPNQIIYSVVGSIVLLSGSMLLFNRMSDKLIDVV